MKHVDMRGPMHSFDTYLPYKWQLKLNFQWSDSAAELRNQIDEGHPDLIGFQNLTGLRLFIDITSMAKIHDIDYMFFTIYTVNHPVIPYT